MSTAGKVLVVLCLLVMPIWVILFSTVAELNRNGTQAVAKLQDDIKKLKDDVARNERDIVTMKDDISLEQKTMTDQLAVLRSRQSDAEKARTDLTEMATRVKLQLAGIEAAVQGAQTLRDQRVAEKKSETEGKKAAEDEVEKLKNEHADLVSELDKLRAEFKETLAANRKLADRLGKAGRKPGS